MSVHNIEAIEDAVDRRAYAQARQRPGIDMWKALYGIGELDFPLALESAHASNTHRMTLSLILQGKIVDHEFTPPDGREMTVGEKQDAHRASEAQLERVA